MDATTYRKLTETEIDTLETNGCSAVDWSQVEAAEGFVPDDIRQCRFAGTVRLGKNVRIDRVHEVVENYEIGDNVTILNTESLVCTGKNAFGNGMRVAVLNESGGREVPIYNGLTAQIAYLTAMYRHRPEAVQAIEKLIDTEIKNTTPKYGQLGKGTYIAHCGALTDIRTGENAVLKGSAELTNGTINSIADSPTRIGRGVIARDFITADGAEITDLAHIEKCFVGQGSRIGKGFTAQNSLFFANCECEQGEASAVFAGPYTVTHHKSTLLIGGMFSFYNAGSNTNQSNHMYRLGPIHQGVLERGCKTGSGSYILFPARIGAFSVVTGRHYGHPDTSLLPFSYLLEENGKTILLPGATLKSIGLARDLEKWPQRDRRKSTKHDPIVFDGLNPYTVEKIVGGLALLGNSGDAGDLPYNGTCIPAQRIEKGCKIYRTAIDLYLGEAVIRRLKEGKNLSSAGKMYREWSDLSGLTAPNAEIGRILEILPSMHSIHELKLALAGLYEHYQEWEWGYAVSLAECFYAKPVDEFTPSDWSNILEKGISATAAFGQWQQADAAKEFAPGMQVGYGPDSGEAEHQAEFTAIHGTPETNSFLEKLQREYELKITEAEKLRDNLK